MAIQWILVTATLACCTLTVHARPHQIHGLLLYPNKEAWCETKEIEMVITHPHCKPQTFSNKVCVGQCFSYATPRTKPPNQVEEKLKYCDQCKPSNTTWKQITLDCEDSPHYTTFTKDVEIIEECSCQACFNEQHQRTNMKENTSLEDLTEDNVDIDVKEQSMSPKEYMVHARKKLTGEDHGMVASREDVEKHGKKRIQHRYRHLDRDT